MCTVQGCGKRFTEYSSLYKHHVVHTHSKPYHCNHCGKTYRQTSTLAMHKRTAHGEDTTAELEAQVYNEQIFGKFNTQVYNEQIFCLKFSTWVYNERSSHRYTIKGSLVSSVQCII